MPKRHTLPPRPERDALETELDRWVTELCRVGGWMRYHVVRPERGPAGFPDLILSKGDVFAVVEEKRSYGPKGGRFVGGSSGTGGVGVDAKPEQAAWLDAAARARWLLSCVWRPTDAVRIEEFLRGDRPDPPGLWYPGQVRPLL